MESLWDTRQSSVHIKATRNVHRVPANPSLFTCLPARSPISQSWMQTREYRAYLSETSMDSLCCPESQGQLPFNPPAFCKILLVTVNSHQELHEVNTIASSQVVLLIFAQLSPPIRCCIQYQRHVQIVASTCTWKIRQVLFKIKSFLLFLNPIQVHYIRQCFHGQPHVSTFTHWVLSLRQARKRGDSYTVPSKLTSNKSAALTYAYFQQMYT